MSAEVWEQVYQRLAELIEEHRTTLIFVNTRRMAERVTRQLSDRLGDEHVTAHHGSLAKEQRLDAEQRLKHGKLKALVATASLELGIDIGDVDLVCQLGSPRSIASLAAAGRALGARASTACPRAGCFRSRATSWWSARRCSTASRRGELDRLAIPEQPLDVLAQQIVAEVAAREWNEDELYALVRRAWPYRALARDDFAAVVGMLAEGFSTRRGRRGALIHYDAVNHVLRGRRGARLTALTSGGTIPDNADYQVLLEPENHFIGTVNEDFAVESMAGDIFQLGNKSYRIMRVERGVVRVEDAHGMAPTIPFWLGEAPGRSDELSVAVSRLRTEIAAHLRKRSGGRTRVALADGRDRHRRARRPATGRVSGRRRMRRWAACRRRTRSCSSGSSTRSAACSSSSIRPTAAASTAPGAWRCASASAASSISSCRRRRPRTISCSRSRPRTASNWARSRATCIPPPSGRC